MRMKAWLVSVSAVIVLAGRLDAPVNGRGVDPSPIVIAAAQAGDGRVAGAAKRDGKVSGRSSNGGRIGGR